MAVIEKSIRLVGSKGSKDVSALFDSGSTYSCLKPELAEKLGMLEPLPEPMDFETAEEGRRVIAKGLNFYIDGLRFLR